MLKAPCTAAEININQIWLKPYYNFLLSNLNKNLSIEEGLCGPQRIDHEVQWQTEAHM